MGKTNLQCKVATALTIAGSDSGGGAGIQADLKSFSAHGVYGASVITAITAQNTRLVSGVEAVSPAMIGAQIDAVLSDIRIDSIKIGMLATPAVIEAVAVALARYHGPIVLDPVMVSKSGDALLRDDAVSCLTEMLLPRASLLTPNIPEAARLLEGQQDISPEEQGKALLALGPAAVLMKGGHADGPVCQDYLITSCATAVFEAPRIATENTHGTGCSLSSAIAAGLAKSMPLEAAVVAAHRWLHGAIKAADELDIGQGHGPVHHFYDIWR